MDRTFEFDRFSDNFESAVDEFESWPELSVNMVYIMHHAEPDVGIFEAQPDVQKATFFIEETEYDDFDLFVEAVYVIIGSDIEDSEEDVANVLRAQLNTWTNELDGDD